jgi:transposase, IS30 family
MVGCSRHAVTNTLRRRPRPPTKTWNPYPRTCPSRAEESRVGLERGDSFTAIAKQLGRCRACLAGERQRGRDGHRAHQVAYERGRRPKIPKLACRRLAGKVGEWLELWWPPEQIAQRVRIDFPDDPMMRVSHETIYMSLFVEGRGELRRELSRCLRTG